MSSIGGGGLGKELNRRLVIRALTDPQYRFQLQTNPAAALGIPQLTAHNHMEIQRILQLVQRLEMEIGHVADELLCASGRPGRTI